MLIGFTKLVLVVGLIASGFKSLAQDTQVSQDSNVEQVPVQPEQAKVQAEQDLKEPKPSIQIKVDANTYHIIQKDNNLNNKTELSTDKTTETNVNDSQISNTESKEVIKDSTVLEVKPVIVDSVIQPNIRPKDIIESPPVVNPPVEITQPIADDTNKPEAPVIDEDLKKLIVVKNARKTSFYVNGLIGYGLFTTIDDIDTNYSFGFALGYELDRNFSFEFQYSYSEFEDNYNYVNYYFTPSGYTFDQSDFSFLANYKFLINNGFSVYGIGGINFAYRSAYDSYYGYEDDAESFSAVLGLGSEIKVNKNLFLLGNFNYNINLSSSGNYSSTSPLYLAADEDYVIFNIGVKFKF